MSKSIGVVIGRFQTPYLHGGHLDLLHHMCDNHDLRLVVLGSAPTKGSKKNPMNIVTRETLLGAWTDLVQVRSLPDQESDKKWSLSLDQLICTVFPSAKKGTKVVLYGGRDSFIDHYSGKFKTKYVKGTQVQSSTQIRTEVGKTPPTNQWEPSRLKGFREGVIYATENTFPQVFPTVDIAVTKNLNPDGTGPLQVLLGWKTGEDTLRFPGGFVDPSDGTLEFAGKRELQEEAPGIAVEGPLNYVGSTLVSDWRYKGPERVMTTLFHGEYTFGSTTAGDDLEGVIWVTLGKDGRKLVRDSHKPLYDMLVEYLMEKK